MYKDDSSTHLHQGSVMKVIVHVPIKERASTYQRTVSAMIQTPRSELVANAWKKHRVGEHSNLGQSADDHFAGTFAMLKPWMTITWYYRFIGWKIDSECYHALRLLAVKMLAMQTLRENSNIIWSGDVRSAGTLLVRAMFGVPAKRQTLVLYALPRPFLTLTIPIHMSHFLHNRLGDMFLSGKEKQVAILRRSGELVSPMSLIESETSLAVILVDICLYIVRFEHSISDYGVLSAPCGTLQSRDCHHLLLWVSAVCRYETKAELRVDMRRACNGRRFGDDSELTGI